MPTVFIRWPIWCRILSCCCESAERAPLPTSIITTVTAVMKRLLHYFSARLLIAVGVGMLWRAGERIANLQNIPPVHVSALVVAVIVLVSKEALFRYMLRAAERVRSAMLIANAWHARSDAASSLVVAIGIIGSMAGLAFAGSDRGGHRRFHGRADGLDCSDGTRCRICRTAHSTTPKPPKLRTSV